MKYPASAMLSIDPDPGEEKPARYPEGRGRSGRTGGLYREAKLRCDCDRGAKRREQAG